MLYFDLGNMSAQSAPSRFAAQLLTNTDTSQQAEAFAPVYHRKRGAEEEKQGPTSVKGGVKNVRGDEQPSKRQAISLATPFALHGGQATASSVMHVEAAGVAVPAQPLVVLPRDSIDDGVITHHYVFNPRGNKAPRDFRCPRAHCATECKSVRALSAHFKSTHAGFLLVRPSLDAFLCEMVRCCWLRCGICYGLRTV
jgi:hypothetical protein